MRFFFASLLLLIGTPPALAQGLATFNYQRGTVDIARQHPPTLAPLPWQDAANAPAISEAAAVTLNVTIRPITSLTQREGWMGSGITAGEGALFILDQPGKASVPKIELSPALDVLWLDETGRIAALAPSLDVANLAASMAADKPAKALLLLPAGLAANLSVVAGDRLLHPDYFSPPPAVMTAPE